jgi:hypothetical protein
MFNESVLPLDLLTVFFMGGPCRRALNQELKALCARLGDTAGFSGLRYRSGLFAKDRLRRPYNPCPRCKWKFSFVKEYSL